MSLFPSTKAAIAAAASFARCLDVQQHHGERVQRTPAGEPLDKPIAVRAAMRAARIDPDGPDAQLLYLWARTDDQRDVFDDAIEESSSADDYEELFELGEQARARLAELLALVGRALEQLGVVRAPPRIELIEVGWRVLEHPDGRRQVVVVIDPEPDDDTLYGAPEAARAVASGSVGGKVIRAEICPAKNDHDELAVAWVRRWEAGEFATVRALDRALAAEKQWSTRWARKVRRSWGLAGQPGRPSRK